MEVLSIGCPNGPVPDAVELQVSPTEFVIYTRDDDARMRCIVCELPSNHMVWRKIERTGKHHYVCANCEATIPC